MMASNEYPLEKSTFCYAEVDVLQKNTGIWFQFIHQDREIKERRILKIEVSDSCLYFHLAERKTVEVFKKFISNCDCRVDTEFNLCAVNDYILVVGELESKGRKLVKLILDSNDFIGDKTASWIVALCDFLDLNIKWGDRGPGLLQFQIVDHLIETKLTQKLLAKK